MRPITPETLPEFEPSYAEFQRRINQMADRIGVESGRKVKDYRAAVQEWFRDSAVGLTGPEIEILTAMLAEEASNKRFSGNKWLAKGRGGDTAEHPVFIGLQIDKLRDLAGFGPGHWHKLSPEMKVEVAKLCQALHVRAPLHDGGELVDIAADIARDLKATKKEPDEEALVGPFKIVLAAQSILHEDPGHYTSAIRAARKRVQAEEQRLQQAAREGKISGDEYINGVGRKIAEVIGEQTQELLRELDITPPPATGHPMTDLTAAIAQVRARMPEEYRQAVTHLTQAFEGTQQIKGYTEWMFHLLDKLEGDAHFRHFAGMPSTPLPANASLRERLFPNNEHLHYSLAAGSEIEFALRYSQKAIVNTLKEAESLPAGPQREVALAFARAGAADILRNHIRILQKGPHALNLTGDSAKVRPTRDADEQDTHIATRQQVARDTGAHWGIQRKARGIAPITHIDPACVSTRELIAVLDKAATAIESGRYRPVREDQIPIGQGALPPALQVSMQEALDSSLKYPLQRDGISNARAS